MISVQVWRMWGWMNDDRIVIFGRIISWQHVISCLIICGFWNKRVYIIIIILMMMMMMMYLYALGARGEMLRNISSWNFSLLFDIVFIWTLSYKQILMMWFVFFHVRYILAINAFRFKHNVCYSDRNTSNRKFLLWEKILYASVGCDDDVVCLHLIIT